MIELNDKLFTAIITITWLLVAGSDILLRMGL